MEEVELLNQLKDHFRSKYAEIKKRHAQSLAELNQLSDEEWWQRIEEQKQLLPPSLRESDRRSKEQIIASRHRTSRIETIDVEQMATREAQDLLPHLLEYRKRHAMNGDITTDEIHIVTMCNHQAMTSEVIQKFEARLDKEQDPTKRALIELLIDDGKFHQTSMAEFQDPAHLTEDRWGAYSKVLNERLEHLGQRLNEIRQTQRAE